MTIQLNGTAHTCAPDTTIAQLIAALQLAPEGVAVAVDRQVVPRSQHDRIVLSPGAKVEILRAVGGG